MKNLIPEFFRENRRDFYLPSIKRLRIILMFLMCINLFGFPILTGYAKVLCGFVPLAFFILSGFLVLEDTEDRPQRILRCIKRTAVVFVILTVVYFIINLFYYGAHGLSFKDIASLFTLKRFWFNFLVMNVWQFEIGNAIWYVQALLYAYIIIYFLDRWKLLRHDWKIAAVLLAVTVVTGELAGIIKWNIAGYSYIPGNFFTRALPYILLGCFVRRKILFFTRFDRFVYECSAVIGLALAVGEVVLFGKLGVGGYYGHLIGLGIAAFSVCMIAFIDPKPIPGFEERLGLSRWHINLIYYICQPVSMLVALLVAKLPIKIVSVAIGFIGIAVFFVCLAIAWIIAFVPRVIRHEFGEDKF